VSEKQWIAIIAFPFKGGTKPYVLHDNGLENVATFGSVKEIERVAEKHLLRHGEWTAFNFETGDTEWIR
jgi:hypothetical protein